MAHAFTFALLFVTCLLSCRAELSGSWFSANVINDGDFSPKPISEIFTSSQPPFSSTHPIIVLQPLSTPSPRRSTGSSSSSVSTAAFTSDEYVSSFSTTPSTVGTQTSYVPSPPSTQQTISSSVFPEPKPTFDIRQPFLYPYPQDSLQPNNPNYFLIYQQGPQNLQNFPPSSTFTPSSTFQPSPNFQSSSTFQPELSTPQSTFSTVQPELSTPQSTFSTPQSTFSTPQSTFSTFQPQVSTMSSTFSTFRPDTSSQMTSMAFQPSSDSTFPPNLQPGPRPTSSSTLSSLPVRTTRTVFPCNTTARPSNSNPLERYPSLRIRMIAPSGSITNVNINQPASTTRRTTTRRTTTRKPTTTRTRRTRKNRNTFDGCVNACEGGGRKPICATPLSQMPIDPDKLKGFPSVCHMACHNSFKRDQYEMLVEGRCGRLRTRIKPVDSDKLKRVELKKSQYTVVDGPQTVVEISSLKRQ